MLEGWIGLVEMGLVFGAVLVFGFWQFRTLAKYKDADAKVKAEREAARKTAEETQRDER